MFIKDFQLFNYKSYLDSGKLEFTPGINIIVGRNNSGKTALLEALSLKFTNKIHKSLKALPDTSTLLTENSRVKILFCLKKDELRLLLDKVEFPLKILSAEKHDSIDTINKEYWRFRRKTRSDHI